MSGYKNKKIIQTIAPIISRLGIHQLFKKSFGGAGHILMFHRIVASSTDQRIHNHLSLEITPAHLEEVIQYFINRNYDIISLDEMHSRLTQRKAKNKFVVFTFDDGYLDNYTLAYPIFKKYNLPFTIYVATCFPDRTITLWWYLLENYIIKNTTINFNWLDEDHSIRSASYSEKESAFAQLRQFITQSASQTERDAKLKSILGDYKSTNTSYANDHCMNWDQVAELNSDPLVTIGSHTITHPTLAALPEPEMIYELRQSKTILESFLKSSVHHLAYPFGKKGEVGKREFDIARTLGYLTATTTRIGNIQAAHIDHPCALPRININAVTKTDVLNLQVAGLVSMIVNKGKNVITE